MGSPRSRLSWPDSNVPTDVSLVLELPLQEVWPRVNDGDMSSCASRGIGTP